MQENGHRQVSLLSKEAVEAFKERGAKVEDGDFGENLLVEGFDLKKLPVGTVFSCNGVVLEMTRSEKNVIPIVPSMKQWVTASCQEKAFLPKF